MELNLKHLILMFFQKATHFILILSQKNKILRRFIDILGEENSKNIKEIKIKNDSIFFYEVNSVTKYRNDTFSPNRF